MSEVHTDEELIAQARLRAFEGLMITVMLADKGPLFATLRDHFTAILEAIDGEKDSNSTGL
jgi:hypothetical protein